MISVISFWLAVTILVGPMALSTASIVVFGSYKYLHGASKQRFRVPQLDKCFDYVNTNSCVFPILFIGFLEILYTVVTLICNMKDLPYQGAVDALLMEVIDLAYLMSPGLPIVAVGAGVVFTFKVVIPKAFDVWYVIKYLLVRKEKSDAERN